MSNLLIKGSGFINVDTEESVKRRLYFVQSELSGAILRYAASQFTSLNDTLTSAIGSGSDYFNPSDANAILGYTLTGEPVNDTNTEIKSVLQLQNDSDITQVSEGNFVLDNNTIFYELIADNSRTNLGSVDAFVAELKNELKDQPAYTGDGFTAFVDDTNIQIDVTSSNDQGGTVFITLTLIAQIDDSFRIEPPTKGVFYSVPSANLNSYYDDLPNGADISVKSLAELQILSTVTTYDSISGSVELQNSASLVNFVAALKASISEVYKWPQNPAEGETSSGLFELHDIEITYDSVASKIFDNLTGTNNNLIVPGGNLNQLGDRQFSLNDVFEFDDAVNFSLNIVIPDVDGVNTGDLETDLNARWTGGVVTITETELSDGRTKLACLFTQNFYLVVV